ncbi:hypothetical protein [Brachybacterium tyrofermentans]|uniref:hypothetical protein n=1 Tax=Brachybacterium tyrofermentans TaxID=47848 RepID=UPI003F90E8C6
MATEIVLLSEMPLPVEVAHRALIRILPEAETFDFSAPGLSMHVDLGQTTVLTVCESVEVEIEGAGADLLAEPAPHYRYWTDIAIPDHSLESTARTAAEEMARAVSGRISDKR